MPISKLFHFQQLKHVTQIIGNVNILLHVYFLLHPSQGLAPKHHRQVNEPPAGWRYQTRCPYVLDRCKGGKIRPWWNEALGNWQHVGIDRVWRFLRPSTDLQFSIEQVYLKTGYRCSIKTQDLIASLSCDQKHKLFPIEFAQEISHRGKGKGL